ncbi:TIGR00341 family protein [Sulfurimonas aquatica]|nr:TIGR00341 family protein [Sulfurimonas aquatica]
MYKKIYLIVDELASSETFDELLNYIKTQYKIVPDIHSHMDMFEEGDENELYLLYLDDDEIKIFFKNHLQSKLNIGILPNDKAALAMKNYGISKDLFEAVDDALNIECRSEIDLLICNELIAFNSVVIGDMHGMNRLNLNESSRWQKVKYFFNNLKNIKFKSYSLSTSKEHTIKTVASGITILEHTIQDEKLALKDSLSIHDGKLNAFILAPTSLISYLWYLLSIFFYQKVSIKALPRSLGYIKTANLTISSSEPIEYMLDGALLSAQEVELNTMRDTMKVHLGRSLIDNVKVENNQVESKDIINLNALPHGEMNKFLIDKKLPLFKKASEDDFKELFLNLRSSAKFTYVFLILMILSTLLATTGLFANSAPVIIGAMILAPLMAPIISLSMGVVRAENLLISQSIRTLSIGIVMALFFSAIFTFIIPLERITPEMQGRLNPNILDLMVAILSGIAGAYANSKEEVAKSLAGVAIAVALVPPLSVTGIGIGLGSFDVIYGSFLLFITNLIGITLSAALTFIVLGYSPVTTAKKGIYYTSVLLTIITIPLIFSFADMIEKNKYMSDLESVKSIILHEEKIELNIYDVKLNNDVLVVDLQSISEKPLTHEEYVKIKQSIEKKLQRRIVLEVTPMIIVR